jgi:hypothetical protein
MRTLRFLLELLLVSLLAACGGGDDLLDKGFAQKAASGLVRPESGVWWNPAESGRGYTIELQGNILVFYTYLFDVSGRASWYGGAAALNADGSFDAQLQEYVGGQSLTGSYKLPTVKGNVTSIHLACNTTSACTLTWAGGTIPIQRIRYGNQAVVANPPQSGLWWNPAESGRGYFLDLQGNIFAFYTYIFDSSGNATWYMSAGPLNADGSYDGKLQEYSGGQSLTGSYKAPTVKGNVSSVHWACTSPTTCTLTWAGGTVPLQRFMFGPPQSAEKLELVNLPGVTSNTITQQTGSTGATSSDMKVVSSEYLVQLKGADSTGGSIRITIPINAALLPAGAGKPMISPEYYDTTTKTWLPTGSFVVYDSAAQTLSFTVDIADASLLPVTAASPLRRTFGAGRWAFERLYHAYTWASDSGTRTVKQLTGSNFIIHYYAPGKDATHSVPANWNGSDTINVPSYIQILDDSLNQAYSQLQLLTNSKGDKLMPDIAIPQHVYVGNLGESSGVSPPGGPLSIATRNIDDIVEMRNVAAHELVHVYQGYAVNIAATGAMRFFIEATANYYAGLVNALTDAQKYQLYTDKTSDKYLNVPLDTSDDQNHYAVAFFLDWLSKNYGNTAIVGDMLQNLQSTWDARVTMDNILKLNGEPNGINGAYDKYLVYLATHPQDYDNANLKFRGKMHEYTFRKENGLISSPGRTNVFRLDSLTTFMHMSRFLVPFQSAYLSLTPPKGLDSMLVIDARGSSAGFPGFKSYTYDFSSDNNSSYQGKAPIDGPNGMVFPDHSKNLLTIPNFTAMEQYFVNSSWGLWTSHGLVLEVDYYLLIRPKVTAVQTNAVLWDSSAVGNIPPEYVKGYDVYKDAGDGTYIKINPASKGLIPPAVGSTKQMSLICTTTTDCNDSIKPTDKIVVVIEDKYGNRWPQVKESTAPISGTCMGGKTSDFDFDSTMAFRGDAFTLRTTGTGHISGPMDMLVTSRKISKYSGGYSAELVGMASGTMCIKIDTIKFDIKRNTIPCPAGINPGTNGWCSSGQGSCPVYANAISEVKIGQTDAKGSIVIGDGMITLARNSQKLYATFGYKQTCYFWDNANKAYKEIETWGGGADTFKNGASDLLVNAWSL